MPRSSLTCLSIRRITDPDDRALNGFLATYRDVFAEAPYHETYKLEWIVEHVWRPHLPHCIMVAEHASDHHVVGLACCHAVDADTEPAIKEYLLAQELPFNPQHTVFMSELAVRSEVRRAGLGTTLVYERLAWARGAGFTNYVMRTAADGSNSQVLYRKIGAREAPFVQDVGAGEVASASPQRIYMWGEIATALAGEEVNH
jgi:GNAT superfamily N-acetyltransferase